LGIAERHLWEDAAGKWLGEKSHKRTLEWDVRKLKWLHGSLGGLYVDEITRAVIDRVKADLLKSVKPATANRYLALIRSILFRARDEWEWIVRAPKITLAREPRGRTRWLTPEEFMRLLRELPPHLVDMALFSVLTGLRQKNVRLLEWVQVDLKLRHIYIPPEQYKTDRAHSVPLNDLAYEVVVRQKGKHPRYVFTYQGEPVTNVNTKAWKSALTRAGITDFRWHDLRHTFAVWLRREGVPTHELRELGGWQSLAMVERYAHVAPQALQAAADKVQNPLKQFGNSLLKKEAGPKSARRV
jgi:integrase